jgi:hypothetical protein
VARGEVTVSPEMKGYRMSDKTVRDAVLLLDMYASQGDLGIGWMSLVSLGCMQGFSREARSLAHVARGCVSLKRAFDSIEEGRDAALEAAQRLRDGWRP